MLEQPHGLVGAREHHLGVGYAPRLLLRHIRGETLDLFGIGLAVAQGECGVPCLGDHAVGTQAVIKLM